MSEPLLVPERTSGQKNAAVSTTSEASSAVQAMKATALNFGARFINDADVRRAYLAAIDKYAREIMASVRSGEVTAEQGQRLAYAMRDRILVASRLRLSDLGRATSEYLKPASPALPTLQERYAQKIFSRAFNELEREERNQVFLAIVESSGRNRLGVTVVAKHLDVLGRGLVVISLASSIYTIATAEDKVKATEHEAATTGGGVLGGMAGGALAGAVFGPADVVTVPLGIFIGGVLGAMGADYTFHMFMH